MQSKKVVKFSPSPPHSGKNNTFYHEAAALVPDTRADHIHRNPLYLPLLCLLPRGLLPGGLHLTVLTPRTASAMECFLGELRKVVIIMQQTLTERLLEAPYWGRPVGPPGQ